MEFPFPPDRLDYMDVFIARWGLTVWAPVSIAILINRWWRWKLIHPHEMFLWLFAGGVTVFAVSACQSEPSDHTDWLVFFVLTALSVSAIGIGFGLVKCFSEGSPIEKMVASAMAFVVLIIGFNIIFSPSTGHPREGVFRTQCRNNLKQIGLAMDNYHSSHGLFPPSASGDKPTSWRVSILPYLDQGPLFDQYDQRRTWDEPSNANMARKKVEALICPSNDFARQDPQERWFTAYSMLTGPHTMGAKPAGTARKEITDGSSNTLFVVEACGAQIVWTEPRDVDVAFQPTGVNLNGPKKGTSSGWLSGYHRNGVNVLLADGSVRFICANVEPAILKKLATIDDGEEIGDF
jgi:prepilin-type processing-associated H-X9-DG protein